MKLNPLLRAIAFASVLIVGAVFAEPKKEPVVEPKPAGCCAKAAKEGHACTHGECCVAAAKAGKNCEHCGGVGDVAVEKKK